MWEQQGDFLQEIHHIHQGGADDRCPGERPTGGTMLLYAEEHIDTAGFMAHRTPSAEHNNSV